MRLECHVHTKYSIDSFQFHWLLYIMCRIKKINYIAITEHNRIDGAKAFDQYCRRHGGKVKVIVGEEIMTAEGEIIGLFIDELVKPFLSVEETIMEIKKQNGIVYIPHPYDLKRERTVLKESAIKKYSNLFDAIEIHNGRNASKEYDGKQMALSKKYNIMPIVGSDAHTFFEIGRNYLVMPDVDVTVDNFKIELQKATFVCSECLYVAHYVTKLVKGIKKIKQGEFYELYRLVFRKIKE